MRSGVHQLFGSFIENLASDSAGQTKTSIQRHILSLATWTVPLGVRTDE